MAANRSSGLTLGYAALVCSLCLPVLLALAGVTGYVIRGVMVYALLLTFLAAPLLACIAWRMGSRELAVQRSFSATKQPRSALQARSLGRSTLLLWALLVLLAALTYTRGHAV